MSSSNIFIKSVSTMVPRMFCEFLQSGCNKTRLIELLFEYLQLNKDEVLQTSRSDNLFCSSNNSYQVISRVAVIEDLNFPSYQNEGEQRLFCIVQMSFTEIMVRMHTCSLHLVTQLFWLLDNCQN